MAYVAPAFRRALHKLRETLLSHSLKSIYYNVWIFSRLPVAPGLRSSARTKTH